MKPGEYQLNQPLTIKNYNFKPGTVFFVQYVFEESGLVAGSEIGQEQLHILPIDKLTNVTKKEKINTKVHYLIADDESYGFEKGIVTGTLKAYDSQRNIGIIYFPADKRKGYCGCYTVVRKREQPFNNKTVFVRYSDETWVNTEE